MWQQDSSDDHVKMLNIEHLDKSFPDLRVLSIEDKSLETLKFSRLEKLEEWSFIEGGVLPRLKNLCFEDCHKLKMTLLGDYFPSLTELVVINCEELIPLILPRAQLMQAPLITLKKIAFSLEEVSDAATPSLKSKKSLSHLYLYWDDGHEPEVDELHKERELIYYH
ncbi:hypothetical protein G4B88_023417 [Cannabis sativa]|uniref:Disease resistance protein n=1 Tax=Cannabis sativa TaxID=3483 RepID=A0A7J6DJC7_CANSA|nr:hypothetical protein G4B88_023417 [Cannabis sativa]